MPNVARGEEAGDIGLQVVRRPADWPSLGPAAVAREIRSGHEVAGFVARHAGFDGPMGRGSPADADEEPPRPDGSTFAGLAVGDGDGLKAVLALDRRHLAIAPDRD